MKVKDIILLAVAGLVLLLATTHRHLWLPKASVIIGGHTKDIVNRIIVNDKYVDGLTIKSGIIDVKAVGQDSIHNSKGSFKIIFNKGALYLQLDSDFETSLGPDYHVYVGNKPIVDESGFDETFVDLGELKSGSGASFYTLDSDTYTYVLIWCKEFGAYIGSGELNE